ncbi:serine hydrolase [Formosa sp. S-31]|uniref:serine hydrolase n=1 Tax=Formosa sp. S-31 TaxID=2790949 RepID=UPI003EB8A01A
MTRILKVFYLILFICSVNLPSAKSQINSSEIDALIARALDSFAVAGVAVAIVKDGKIVHEKGYGVKSIDTKTPVNASTNFGIASNSKAFTCSALAMLVEDGKLTWTDKVVQHIPEFTMYNPYVQQNFTIEDLLTHRSGLSLGMGDLMFFPDGSDFTIDDIISSFQHFKPVSAFRTKWDYDNLLYLVAGEIIKRVSGMSYETFIETRIFKPLGMDHSYSSYNYIKDHSNTAVPHLNEGKTITTVRPEQWDPEKINGAAGGIYSNVHDLAQWMLVQLNHGKYGENLDKELFSLASQNAMWTIHTVQQANKNPRYNSHFAGYGLGWQLTDAKGNMVVSHTGGLIGMLSKTLLIPDLNLGIVVLTNTYLDGAGVFSAVSQTIADSYMGLETFDWVATYTNTLKNKNTEAQAVVDVVWQTVKTNKTVPVKPEHYLGTYADAWFGKIDIYLKNNKLWFKSQRSPKLTGELFYYKANTFVCKWSDSYMVDADAFVMFSLDENGLAQSIKMKGISPAIDFSFDFQDLDLQRIPNQQETRTHH